MFIKYPTMRNVPKTHIISLALGDLLVVFFTVPFIGTVYTFSSWPFGEVICSLQETVKDISIGVTVFTLMALSSDRYFAIVNPFRRRVDCGSSKTTIAIAQRNYMKQVAARRKVAKMVLTFVVIFAVCFLPNHVFLMWFYFNPNSNLDFNQFWNVFRIVGFCLSFINSCINPLALYFISGTFRKYFNRHLFCCICPESSKGRRPWTENTFHSTDTRNYTISRKTDNMDMSTFSNGPGKTAPI